MSLITYVNKLPLFTLKVEAEYWASNNGITGSHEYTYEGIIGCVPGIMQSNRIGSNLQSPDHRAVIEPSKTDKKEIKSFRINTKPLPAEAIIRSFVVSGDAGAVFTIWVTNEDNHYYNFSTKSFTSTIKKLYSAKIPSSGFYNGSINFPAITDDDEYTIFISAEGGYETVIANLLSNTNVLVLKNNETGGVPTIKQYVNITTTFSLASPGSSGDYNTLPSDETITRPVGTVYRIYSDSDTNKQRIPISWAVTLSAKRFVVNRQPVLNDFETTITKTLAGDVGDSQIFFFTDVSGLSAGMKVSGTGVYAGSTIHYIDSDDNINGFKTVFMSAESGTVSDGATITFTGIGSSGSDIITSGTKFKLLDDFKVVLDDVTTETSSATTGDDAVIPVDSVNGLKIQTTQTVDGLTTSSSIVTLDSVTGLWIGQTLVAVSAGSLTGTPTIIRLNTATKTIELSLPQTFADGITLTFANNIISGIGINTGSSDGPLVPYIVSISSLNITASAVQTLEDGIKLTFTGSSRSATISGTIEITSFGTSNSTTTLNLDNILSVTA